LYEVFSDVNKIVIRRKVVTNNVGMKAGFRTCHTVLASPVRDAISKQKDKAIRDK
jgi:hypothetical protein